MEIKSQARLLIIPADSEEKPFAYGPMGLSCFFARGRGRGSGRGQQQPKPVTLKGVATLNSKGNERLIRRSGCVPNPKPQNGGETPNPKTSDWVGAKPQTHKSGWVRNHKPETAPKEDSKAHITMFYLQYFNL